MASSTEAPKGTTLHLQYSTAGLITARAALTTAIEARPFDVTVITACAEAIQLIDWAIEWQAVNGQPAGV